MWWVCAPKLSLYLHSRKRTATGIPHIPLHPQLLGTLRLLRPKSVLCSPLPLTIRRSFVISAMHERWSSSTLHTSSLLVPVFVVHTKPLNLPNLLCLSVFASVSVSLFLSFSHSRYVLRLLERSRFVGLLKRNACMQCRLSSSSFLGWGCPQRSSSSYSHGLNQRRLHSTGSWQYLHPPHFIDTVRKVTTSIQGRSDLSQYYFVIVLNTYLACCLDRNLPHFKTHYPGVANK